jgi:hypothetical protein
MAGKEEVGRNEEISGHEERAGDKEGVGEAEEGGDDEVGDKQVYTAKRPENTKLHTWKNSYKIRKRWKITSRL